MITLNADGKPVITTETIIDEDELSQEKIMLQSNIASCPKLKEKPDEETLIFWNETMKKRIGYAESMQKRITAIDAQLKEINDLK